MAEASEPLSKRDCRGRRGPGWHAIGEGSLSPDRDREVGAHTYRLWKGKQSDSKLCWTTQAGPSGLKTWAI